MNVYERSLSQILDGQTQYVIPLFQRPYSWQLTHWRTLWSDIIETYQSEQSSGHFLGSIVSKTLTAPPGGVSRQVVIDGQQRLTTLSIAIVALRDRLSKDDPDHFDRISNLYLMNQYARDEQRHKVLPSQADQAAFFAIVSSTASSDTGIGQSQMRNAYEFFFDSINESVEDDEQPVDLHRLENTILGRLKLVSIDLNNDDNEYRIFESLNYKGAPLSQADLLRNYFFMRIPAEQADEVFRNVWHPMQDTLPDQNALAEFFRYQVMADHRRFVSAKDIYQAWREDLQRVPDSQLVDKLRELSTFAMYFNRIIEPSNEPDAAVREWLERLSRWGGQTVYPFVLWLFEEAARRELDSETVAEVLGIIESYRVRRMLCGIQTTGENRFFAELVGRVAGGRDLVADTRQVLSRTTYRRRWPTDEELIEELPQYHLYSVSRSEQRNMILESFERDYGHKEQVDMNDLQVEHVMPRVLTDEWRKALGTDADTLHERLLHTPGNLTLTGYNPELSNRPFQEKRALLAESNIAMNKEIAEEIEWGEEQIRARAERLAERAIEIWPGPARPGATS